jgi:hypothetical protein
MEKHREKIKMGIEGGEDIDGGKHMYRRETLRWRRDRGGEMKGKDTIVEETTSDKERDIEKGKYREGTGRHRKGDREKGQMYKVFKRLEMRLREGAFFSTQNS